MLLSLLTIISLFACVKNQSGNLECEDLSFDEPMFGTSLDELYTEYESASHQRTLDWNITNVLGFPAVDIQPVVTTREGTTGRICWKWPSPSPTEEDLYAMSVDVSVEVTGNDMFQGTATGTINLYQDDNHSLVIRLPISIDEPMREAVSAHLQSIDDALPYEDIPDVLGLYLLISTDHPEHTIATINFHHENDPLGHSLDFARTEH